MLYSLRGYFPRIQPPEEEVQFQGVDLVLHQQDLESHLGREDQLVTLEQTPDNIYRDITKFQQDNCVPCCVLEHLESDGVCEIFHSVGHIRVHDSALRRHNFSVDLSFFTFMATSKTTLNALRLNWYMGLILLRSLRMK